jgi:hypothetical protein
MDRREALRKLAAGGAVAAGASVVLSSNDVAFAASPPGTGLSGVPGPGEPLEITYTPNNNGTITIADATQASCASGALTVTYSWRILGYDVSGSKRRLAIYTNPPGTSALVQGPNENICTSCPTPYSSPSTTNNDVVLRKNNPGGQIDPLDAGDEYSVGVLVTWRCGSNTPYTREFAIGATYPNVPVVTAL